MSIELVLFLLAVIILLVIRNWDKLSSIVTVAGGTTTGIRTFFVWIAGNTKTMVGSRAIGIFLWITFMVSVWLLFPEVFAEWTQHWNIFIVSQIVAIIAIFFLPKATPVIMACVIALMLYIALGSTFWPEKENTSEVAQASRDDTGWVRDPYEKVLEKRRMVVRPGQSKIATIPERYRFRINCTGHVEIKVYGKTAPIPCSPKPGIIHLGDTLRTVGGIIDLEFITQGQLPSEVVISRLPK